MTVKELVEFLEKHSDDLGSLSKASCRTNF